MSSSSSGMFFLSTTGPADLSGSAWDATGEGQQNFADFTTDLPDMHADAEDHGFAYGQTTPRKDQPDGLDGLPSNWALPAASLAGAEPMRRAASRSSSNGSSRKHRTLRASSVKSRPSISSASSRPQSHMSFDMSGNSYAVAGGALSHARIVDVNQQYLVQDPHSPPLYSGLMGIPTDGLSYHNELGAVMAQHVDPACTQIMDYELSPPGNSPPASWTSSSAGSRRSSPGPLDGTWSPQVPFSPADTYNSSSSDIQSESPRNSRKYGAQMTEDGAAGLSMDAGDNFALPAAFSRRQSSEGESARDHPLYKDVQPLADGLYHCPWEGTSVCNHKAEKLKCNYDKFVDSHLKPYRCKHDSCENAKFSSTACLLRHEREAHAMHGHGDKPYLCTYDGCDRSVHGNGFPRQWNLRDHMRRVHQDNGPVQAPVPASPPPVPASTAKPRKKNRKPSLKAEKPSASARAAEAAQNKFQEHRKELTNLVSSIGTADDPKSLELIQEAQDQLSAMGRISTSMRKSDLLSGGFQRGFP